MKTYKIGLKSHQINLLLYLVFIQILAYSCKDNFDWDKQTAKMVNTTNTNILLHGQIKTLPGVPQPKATYQFYLFHKYGEESITKDNPKGLRTFYWHDGSNDCKECSILPAGSVHIKVEGKVVQVLKADQGGYGNGVRENCKPGDYWLVGIRTDKDGNASIVRQEFNIGTKEFLELKVVWPMNPQTFEKRAQVVEVREEAK